jgi:hypothetical protein
MNQKEWIHVWHALGEYIDKIIAQEEPQFETKHQQNEMLNDLLQVIKTEHRYNGWFTPSSIITSLKGIRSWLYEDHLTEWLKPYPLSSAPKKVLIVMAGNLPFVGFHDVLCTLLSGNKAVIKLSSKDQHLLPTLLKIVSSIEPRASEYFEFTLGKVTHFDAVIATGSNNSVLYFQQYFGHVPNIFRKNRTGIAVLNGTETDEQLFNLGKDIFTYFGLGCRNVTHLLISDKFDLNRFFSAVVPFGDIINHHKYANNYDYHRALYLLNKEDFLDNNFILIKEHPAIFSPVAVLHVTRYKDDHEIEDFIQHHQRDIQVIVGNAFLPFGMAQNPKLLDYADGVDTLFFLGGI